jgi:hypothetical protein
LLPASNAPVYDGLREISVVKKKLEHLNGTPAVDEVQDLSIPI